MKNLVGVMCMYEPGRGNSRSNMGMLSGRVQIVVYYKPPYLCVKSSRPKLDPGRGECHAWWSVGREMVSSEGEQKRARKKSIRVCYRPVQYFDQEGGVLGSISLFSCVHVLLGKTSRYV